MEETLDRPKRRWGGVYRKMSVQVRLLNLACLLFIVAQDVFREHPWNSAIQIVACLLFIAAQWIGLQERRGT
ncbi:MAG: hypothetical protein WBY53_05755 [Acidobacteriaceae bacterium]